MKILFERNVVLSLAAALAVTFAALLPCLSCGFTNWDDQSYVTQNPQVRDLSWHGVKTIFSSTHSGLYKPLVILSFAVEYRLVGLNPFVYHLDNLLFHLACTALVFIIFFLLSREWTVAFVTALLFGIHPMHVESVAWISERKDMLYAFFFLAALLSYILFRGGNGRKYYWLSVSMMFVSLLAKPAAALLPFSMLLVDYLQGRALDRRALADKIPFFILGAVFIAAGFLTSSGGKVMFDRAGYSAYDVLSVVCCSVLMYLWKIIIPAGMSAFYPYPLKHGGILPLAVLASPLILGALAALAWRLCRGRRAAVFASWFFVVNIVLFLQWLPAAPSMAFDHYSYISYIGFFYLFALWLCDRINGTARLPWAAGFAFAALILCVVTWNRCLVWRDSVSLWTDVIKKYPAKALAYNNRASAYLEAGRPEAALADLNIALELKPWYEEAVVNRALVFRMSGDTARAVETCQALLEKLPSYDRALALLSELELQRGAPDKAMYYASRALSVSPGLLQPLVVRGNIYAARGELAPALADFEKALSVSPDFDDLRANIGKIYIQLGRDNDARAAFEYLIARKAALPDALFGMALVEKNAGRRKEASEYFRRAAAINSAFGVYSEDFKP